VIAQPSGDVYRIAEQGDLPLRVATLADNDRPGVNASAELRCDAEFASVVRRKIRDTVFGGNEAAQRSGIPLRIVA
jgi:hypothetical protein